MPMNEYGEIIRNSSPPPPIPPRNNSHNNNHSNGGSGLAIIVGIIILVVVIRFIIKATNNNNDSYVSDTSQNITSNINEDVETANPMQNDENQDAYYEDNELSEYILPYSNSEYISYSNLEGLSQTEVLLACNEIYARHGRKFDTDYIREYFESKSWYVPQINPNDFSESVFNEYEKQNINTIVNYEREKGWK